jgi:hypothetical protein
MNLEQDLRITSDEMLRTLEQLQRLEHEKRAELPGTARFVRLATEIEKLAAMVFAQTNTQQSLAEQSRAVGARGATMNPIDDVPPARDVSVVLTEWREAERRLSAAPVESAEHAKAAADARRLREEYHRTYRSQSEPKRGS